MSGYLTREEKDAWKDDVIKSRLSDSESLEQWLKEKSIPYEKDTNGNYEVYNMSISNTLKVHFGSARKGYQYNIEGVKKRILESL